MSIAAIAWPRGVRGRMIRVRPTRSLGKFGLTHLHEAIGWSLAPPFAVNPRGVLVHRVRDVTTHVRDGEVSHYSAGYLCGNGCNVDVDRVAEVLVADPPRNRLLCDFCEAKAARKQLPTADVIAGRHVHRGVLVARQVCCLKPVCS